MITWWYVNNVQVVLKLTPEGFAPRIGNIMVATYREAYFYAELQQAAAAAAAEEEPISSSNPIPPPPPPPSTYNGPAITFSAPQCYFSSVEWWTGDYAILMKDLEPAKTMYLYSTYGPDAIFG